MKTLKVAVNVSTLNVPNLLDRSNMYQLNMNNNITTFANCVAQLAIVSAATTDLHTTANTVAAAGLKKKDTVRDKKKYLVQQLLELGHLVEVAADGDEAIVHLAGMDVKHVGIRNFPSFAASQGEQGTVTLKVKAVAKTLYKWLYSTDNATWQDGGTSDVSKTSIANLTAGAYWFKVVFLDGKGGHESNVISFAVN